MIEAKGYGQYHRLYEIQNGNHVDSLMGATAGQQLPNLELIQPHAQKAFDLLEDWVERGVAPPPNQCVRRGGKIEDKPQSTDARTCLSPSPSAQIIDNLAVLCFAQSAACAAPKRSRPLGVKGRSLVASVMPALQGIAFVCFVPKAQLTAAENPSRIDLRLMLNANR